MVERDHARPTVQTEAIVRNNARKGLRGTRIPSCVASLPDVHFTRGDFFAGY
jgi:hypothetical protein